MSSQKHRMARLCVQLARRGLHNAPPPTRLLALESTQQIWGPTLCRSPAPYKTRTSDMISQQFIRSIVSSEVLEKQLKPQSGFDTEEDLSNMPLHPNPLEASATDDNEDTSASCEKTLADLKLKKERKKQREEERARRKKEMAVPSLYVEVVNKGKSAVRSTSNAVLAVPGYIRTGINMSAAEWRESISSGWGHFKHEMKHYWVGTKLLWVEIKITAKHMRKIMKGKTLTRRERKQLLRTTSDLLRVVPFAMFVLIPFMEVFLPLALKLFPNMLPSTFQDKHKKEEDMRRKVSAKIEVAKFLQDAVDEWAVKVKKGGKGEKMQARAKELQSFMKKVRAGEHVSNEEMIEFAHLFNNELTLENMGRTHLVMMCRLMRLNTFGTDAFLRYQLRSDLRKLAEDDQMIIAEGGVEMLSEAELKEACRMRSMRWDGESIWSMRRQMTEWLDLSLNHKLPSSLLILSRAFTLTHARLQAETCMKELQDTISALPEEVVEEVELSQCSEENSTEGLERKLEFLQAQEELCNTEEAQAEEMERETEKKKGEKKEKRAKANAGNEAVDAAAGQTAASGSQGQTPNEVKVPTASAPDLALEEMTGKQAKAAEAKLTQDVDLATQEMTPGTAGDEKKAVDSEKVEAKKLGEEEVEGADDCKIITEEEVECAVKAKRKKEMKALAENLAAISTPSIVADKRLELLSMLKEETKRYAEDELEESTSEEEEEVAGVESESVEEKERLRAKPSEELKVDPEELASKKAEEAMKEEEALKEKKEEVVMERESEELEVAEEEEIELTAEEKEELKEKEETEKLKEDCDKLRNQVDIILEKLQQDLDEVDNEVQGTLQILDEDLDGKLTVEELKKVSSVVCEQVEDDEIVELLKESDLIDDDGKISVKKVIEMAAEDTDSDEDVVSDSDSESEEAEKTVELKGDGKATKQSGKRQKMTAN